jgi:hypothetical protein
MCLGVNALALVLNENFRKLGCLELWWLGGIYSPQPPSGRWERLLAMGAPDSSVRHRTGPVHCPVRRHVTQPLGFESSRPLAPLSSSGTGQSGTPLTFCYDFCHAQFMHCSPLQSRLLRELVVAPLAHRTVR